MVQRCSRSRIESEFGNKDASFPRKIKQTTGQPDLKEQRLRRTNQLGPLSQANAPRAGGNFEAEEAWIRKHRQAVGASWSNIVAGKLTGEPIKYCAEIGPGGSQRRVAQGQADAGPARTSSANVVVTVGLGRPEEVCVPTI